MKNLLRAVVLLLAGVASFAALSGVALADQQDGFIYSVKDNKAAVLLYTGQGGDVVIPDALGGYPVTRVMGLAFVNSNGMEISCIHIPATVETIDDNAFNTPNILNETTIGSYLVDDDSEYFSSSDGVLYNKAMTKLIACPSQRVGLFTVVDGINEINANAFYKCSSITEIDMTDSVNIIGAFAFSDCSQLTKITLSSNLTNINDWTFEGCVKLEDIALPDNMETIGSNVFTNCHSLREIYVPNSVTSMGDANFGDCFALTTVHLSDNISTIGQHEFSSCWDLANVHLPTGATSIGKAAFINCTSLQSITLPGSLHSIGEDAFDGCSALEDIIIPDSVTQIGSSAFFSCSALKTVHLPSGITSIRTALFDDCNQLQQISIPDGVTSIGLCAFNDCTNLKKADMPDKLTVIADSAFSGCKNLQQVILPDSLTRICDGAFQGCSALKSLYFYSNLPTIESNALPNNGMLDVYYHISKASSWTDFDNAHSFCHLTLDLQNGSKPTTDIAILSVNKLTEPTQPARDSYDFTGWYEDSACEDKWDFANDTVTDDIVLYAGWKATDGQSGQPAQQCTVTFNPQNGSAVTKKDFNYNSPITAPTPPTRPGYVFQGWYKESTCVHAWNFSTDKVTANITLYAKWLSTIPVPAAASASYTSVKISWKAIPGARSYEVWRCTTKTGTYLRVGSTSATSFVNTGLTTGRTYYYKVLSRVASGPSKLSFAVAGRPIPAAPTALNAVRSGSTSVRLTWGAAAGATRYEIWRSTSASGTYMHITTASTRTYTNTRLITGRKYYYKVRAYHLEGGVKIYGDWSVVVWARP